MLKSLGHKRTSEIHLADISVGLGGSDQTRISNLIQTSRPSGGLERLYS